MTGDGHNGTMKVDNVVCSGDRSARVVRCGSGDEANDALRALRSEGVDPADVVVVVRGAEFVARPRRWPLRFAPEAVAAVGGAAAGTVLAGAWVGLATAMALLLLVTALRMGRRDVEGAALRGRRYDLIARGPAVGAVDRVLVSP